MLILFNTLLFSKFKIFFTKFFICVKYFMIVPNMCQDSLFDALFLRLYLITVPSWNRDHDCLINNAYSRYYCLICYSNSIMKYSKKYNIILHNSHTSIQTLTYYIEYCPITNTSPNNPPYVFRIEKHN